MNIESKGIILPMKYTLILFSFLPILIYQDTFQNPQGLAPNINFTFILSFFVLCPLIILSGLYMLCKYIKKLSIEGDEIILLQSKVITYKEIRIHKDDIEKLTLKRSFSDIINIHFKNGKKMKLYTVGLSSFGADWIDPKYNEFMSGGIPGKNAHKIAYNISKKLGIPFRSEFIIDEGI